MKAKRIIGTLLVVGCLGLLVAKGMSQSEPQPDQKVGSANPPPSVTTSPTPAAPTEAPRTPPLPAATIAQRPTSTQDLSFEELHSELRRVRDAQKRLKEQENEVLAAMRRKVEEKRKELQDAETVLEQLQGKQCRTIITPRDSELPSPRPADNKLSSSP
jgi:hypothetical protein